MLNVQGSAFWIVLYLMGFDGAGCVWFTEWLQSRHPLIIKGPMCKIFKEAKNLRRLAGLPGKRWCEMAANWEQGLCSMFILTHSRAV